MMLCFTIREGDAFPIGNLSEQVPDSIQCEFVALWLPKNRAIGNEPTRCPLFALCVVNVPKMVTKASVCL